MFNIFFVVLCVPKIFPTKDYNALKPHKINSVFVWLCCQCDIKFVSFSVFNYETVLR